MSVSRTRVLLIGAISVLAVAWLVQGNAVARPQARSPRAAVPASGGGATTSPPADDLGPAFWARQEQLDHAADLVTPILAKDPNYTGVRVDAAGSRLLSVGVAAPASALWQAATALMPAGLSLTFAHSLLTSAQAKTLDAYVDGHRDALHAQGWGLAPLTGPYLLEVQPGTTVDEASMRELRQFGDDTVSVRSDGVGATGRNNDTSPFWGGAQINGPLGSGGSPTHYAGCTGGFGIRSNVNSAYYMITAAHCIKWSDPRYWTNGALLGSATASDLKWDAAYIKMNPGSSADNWVYTSSSPNGPETSAIVAGATADHVGDIMRDSGAAVLLSPYVSITGSFSYAPHNAYTDSATTMSGFLAESDCGCQAVTGHGDSGGPVISFDSSSQVRARGIISGEIEGATCPSWAQDASPCGWAVILADVNPMISSHQATITP